MQVHVDKEKCFLPSFRILLLDLLHYRDNFTVPVGITETFSTLSFIENDLLIYTTDNAALRLFGGYSSHHSKNLQ